MGADKAQAKHPTEIGISAIFGQKEARLFPPVPPWRAAASIAPLQQSASLTLSVADPPPSPSAPEMSVSERQYSGRVMCVCTIVCCVCVLVCGTLDST